MKPRQQKTNISNQTRSYKNTALKLYEIVLSEWKITERLPEELHLEIAITKAMLAHTKQTIKGKDVCSVAGVIADEDTIHEFINKKLKEVSATCKSITETINTGEYDLGLEAELRALRLQQLTAERLQMPASQALIVRTASALLCHAAPSMKCGFPPREMKSQTRKGTQRKSGRTMTTYG